MENQTNSYSENEKSVQNLELKAVVDGEIIPIENIKDPVFSKKMIGDGYGVIPESSVSTILSPASGKLVEVAQAKHAYYIEVDRGVKILIHIGENTLMLNGKGFTSNVEKNDEIQTGQILGTFDADYLREEGYDSAISVIILFNEEMSLGIEPHITKKAVAGETNACTVTYSQS